MTAESDTKDANQSAASEVPKVPTRIVALGSSAGGLKALETLVKELKLPVIVKETGCGFSESTLRRLRGLGVFAVDVSGLGGTHWGRVEGGRSVPTEMRAQAAETFRDWGVGTVESLMTAVQVARGDFDVWASGGVRSGLDAAKLVALGAKHVGLAMPVIEAALQGEEALDQRLELLEFEMKTALFCTGAGDIQSFQDMKAWHFSNRFSGSVKT